MWSVKFVINVWRDTSAVSAGVKFVGSAWSREVGFVLNAIIALAERPRL